MNDREQEDKHDERGEAVRRACDDFRRRRASGEDISVDAFLASRQDLDPEQRIAVKRLLIIDLARERAAARPPSDDATESAVRPDTSMSPLELDLPRAGLSENGKSGVGATEPRRDAADSPARARRSLGSYELERSLGRGGFGEVLLARNRLCGEYYALKVIPRGSGEVELEGLREYYLAAKGNPHLVEIAGPPAAADDCYYYPMPLADDAKGSAPFRDSRDYEPLTLRRSVERRGPLAMDGLLDLARRMLQGLKLLHDRGRVHCDVKPDNIMQFDGAWKLGDHGLLSPLERVTDRGTRGYRPPEGTHDKTADLYALGKTLFVALTGGSPDDFRLLADGEPPFDRVEPPLAAIRRVICKACAVREERYNHAAEMLADIETLAGNSGVVSKAAPDAAVHFAHAAPDDRHFVPPAEALARLGERAMDPQVKVLSVTGFAGSGKSSLVAHFLNKGLPGLPGARDGAFWWSLDQDPSVDHLLEALLAFVGILAGSLPPESRLEALLEAIAGRSLLIVLDGLQVHQQAPLPKLPGGEESISIVPPARPVGSLADRRLRSLLTGACQGGGRSLVIITSRQPLADLNRWLTAAYCDVNASCLRLNGAEAAQLLRACSGQESSDENCRELRERWDGYALGLRVSAEAIKHGVRLPLGHLDRDLVPAMRRQLMKAFVDYYLPQLDLGQKSLLGVLSLFSGPVPIRILRLLAQRLLATRHGRVPASDEGFRRELSRLCDLGMAIRQFSAAQQEDIYACHPVLREGFAAWFRGEFDGAELRGAATDRSRGDVHGETQQILPLAHAAIACLLEAGRWAEADGVFREQLEDGWLYVQAYEMQAGAMCALEFVGDERRRTACGEQLSEGRLVHYLRMAGLFLLMTGNARDAATYHAAASSGADPGEATRILLNHSLSFSLIGELAHAEEVARAAMELAKRRDDTEGIRHACCCLAHALSLQGRIEEGSSSFKDALATGGGRAGGAAGFREADAVLWGWHLLRVGLAHRVMELMQSELEHREGAALGAGRNHEPFCRWLVAAAEVECGDHARGRQLALDVEQEFRRTKVWLGLAMALLTKAEACRRGELLDEARAACHEAVRLAAERELVAMHAGGLVLQARIHVQRTLAETSSADGEAADAEDAEMQRAFDLGEAMVWADMGLRLGADYAEVRRDAYCVLAVAARAKGDPNWEEYHRECRNLAAQLRADERMAGAAGESE